MFSNGFGGWANRISIMTTFIQISFYSGILNKHPTGENRVKFECFTDFSLMWGSSYKCPDLMFCLKPYTEQQTLQLMWWMCRCSVVFSAHREEDTSVRNTCLSKVITRGLLIVIIPVSKRTDLFSPCSELQQRTAEESDSLKLWWCSVFDLCVPMCLCPLSVLWIIWWQDSETPHWAENSTPLALCVCVQVWLKEETQPGPLVWLPHALLWLWKAFPTVYFHTPHTLHVVTFHTLRAHTDYFNKL